MLHPGPHFEHRTQQPRRLLLQALCYGGRFLAQRGVLLRRFIELRHRIVDLADSDRLLVGGRPDLRQHVVDTSHLRDDIAHRASGVADQLAEHLDLAHVVADESLDLACRLCTALFIARTFRTITLTSILISKASSTIG